MIKVDTLAVSYDVPAVTIGEYVFIYIIAY